MDVLNIEFDLPFDEAIAWGENRVSVLPQFYYGVLQAQARAQAFTVSGLTALQQIQDTLDRLNEALANGLTLADWKKTVNAETFALGKWRMETIFRTHVQTCYSIGRTQQQRENAAHRPFLMYDAINDSRTRPNHTALDNFIAPLNDPIWKKITPPNGFNCRCTTIALTEAQAIKRGWKGFTEYRDKGEPDKGWDYNPADSQDDRLDKIKAERLAKADPVVAGKAGDKSAQNSAMERHPQALPNAENATIKDDKFIKYSLNFDSDRGRHKARVFQSALGYDLTNYASLVEQIAYGVVSQPSILGLLDEHGQRYTVDILVTGPNSQSVVVTTAWIVRPGSDVPDLTSAYVKKSKGDRDV